MTKVNILYEKQPVKQNGIYITVPLGILFLDITRVHPKGEIESPNQNQKVFVFETNSDEL